MRSPFSPPSNVDVAQRTVLGLDYRKILILALTVPAALGLALLWRDASLFVRGTVAAVVALLGLALAFSQIEGQTPEIWFWHWIAFGRRTRFLLHRALRRADSRQAIFAEDEPTHARAGLRIRLSDLFLLTADMVAVAVLVGLTVWFYHGGAHRLAIWWGSLTTLVS